MAPDGGTQAGAGTLQLEGPPWTSGYDIQEHDREMNTASSSGRNRWLALLVLCLVIWILSFSRAIDVLVIPLRLIATVLVVSACALVLKFGPRRLLLCPLPHLAAFALLFYGWCPTISALLVEINLHEGLFATRDKYQFISEYVGSRSE